MNRMHGGEDPARSVSGEAGFTLLELMISLSLLAVMMAMTYSVFSTGMNAVPRGEALAEQSARLRSTTSLISKQVRSIVDYPVMTEDEDEPPPFFWGEASTFSFITSAPQHNGGEGLGWVTYWTDGRTLWMGERLIFSMNSILGTGPDPSGQTMLLDGLSGVRFEYLRLEGEESEWRETWDGFEERNLPASVRVTIQGLNRAESYWVEEIPVMVVVLALGTYDPESRLHNRLEDNEDDFDSGGDGGEGGGE